MKKVLAVIVTSGFLVAGLPLTPYVFAQNLQSEVNRLNQAIREKDNQIQTLNYQALLKQQELERLKQDLADSRHELEGVKRDLANSRYELEGVKRDLANSRYELEGVKKERDSVNKKFNDLTDNPKERLENNLETYSK